MKITYRIPTDIYSYVEVEEEHPSITPENIKGNYDLLTETFKPKPVGPGLPDKDFDKFIERQLLGEQNLLEEYNRMSPDQVRTVQINKRALKRIKSRE